MDNDILSVIGRFEAELQPHLSEATRIKRTINDLCRMAGVPEKYPVEDDATATGVSAIRSDLFYGKPLAAVVAQYLEMRHASNLGAAAVSEIHAALVEGGFDFQTKDDANAKRSLRISLSKNTAKFHKLPNGKYGLRTWYPDIKNRPQSTNGGDDGESDSGSSDEADGDDT